MSKFVKKIFLMFIVIFLFQINLDASLQGKLKSGKPVLKVVFLDVWQGDSMLVIFPNKKTLLIDGGSGGSKYSRFDAGKMIIGPYLRKNRISKIDAIVTSHPHSDHIGGLLNIFKRFKINTVYDSGMTYTTELYMNCLTIIDKKKMKFKIPHLGQKIKIDPDVEVKVLHPSKDWSYSDNPNDNSIVLHIKYGKVSLLFTGDIEESVEFHLIEEGVDINSTILKVAHHGSDTSSSVDFIDAVNPEAAIVSVGKNNKFGHPSALVMSSYEDQGVSIYRTDYDGDITFITDGSHYKIKTEKRRKK